MQLPGLTPAQRLPLPLCAEQPQLLAFLIRQRVAVPHLECEGRLCEDIHYIYGYIGIHFKIVYIWMSLVLSKDSITQFWEIT